MADKIKVTLDLSNPDLFGSDGLSEVSSCLRNLALADNEGRTHRARVARALADQIDAQVSPSEDFPQPELNDPFRY